MKKEIIQAAVSVAIAGMLIYLVRKKIVANKKINAVMKKENEFISMQRQKFSNAMENILYSGTIYEPYYL